MTRAPYSSATARHDTVHREHAVRRDHDPFRVRSLRLVQFGSKVPHVVVPVAVPLRLAQPDAVDDRGVIELVRDDRVLLAEEHFEEAAVRIETGRIENRVVRSEELRHCALELLVEILRSADEPHGREAQTSGMHRVARRFDELLVVREAEIVVGAEIEHLLPRLHLDLGSLLGDDNPLELVEPGSLDLLERFLYPIPNGFRIHQSLTSAPLQQPLLVPPS
jgi:hypothetical protein